MGQKPSYDKTWNENQVLNSYRPPLPSPSQEISTPSDTPSLVATEEFTPSVDSTVSVIVS